MSKKEISYRRIKSGVAVRMKIHPRLMETLMRLRKNGSKLFDPPNKKAFCLRTQRTLKRICAKLGLRYVPPKSIRVKTLTDLAKKNRPEVVRDLAGHSSFKTTHDYYIESNDLEAENAILGL